MGFFDSAFGIHEQALSVATRRSEVLASNLANADTPNYQARDMDFRQILRQQEGGPMTLTTTHPQHVNPGSLDSPSQLMYRVPFNPALDGNTVEADVEQAEFSQNAIRYQASLNFINGRIRGLRDAISGGR